MADASPWARDDADAIERVLVVDGGHLFVGEAGFTLAYQRGTTLSGYDVASVKAACIAAGLPVIDSRCLGFETALHFAIHSPIVEVSKPADPQSWHAMARAPLQHVAVLHHAAGAEVLNLPAVTVAGGGTSASRQEAPHPRWPACRTRAPRSDLPHDHRHTRMRGQRRSIHTMTASCRAAPTVRPSWAKQSARAGQWRTRWIGCWT